MPIGIMRIYCLLFVIYTVMYFSAKDKTSGVKFCTVVHRRPGQGVSHFGELYSPRSPKSDLSGCAFVWGLEHTWSMRVCNLCGVEHALANF